MSFYQRHRIGKAVSLALLCLAAAATAQVESGAGRAGSTLDSLVTKVDQNTYTIGGLRIDKRAREIVIPGWVNLDSGQIEYFATTRGGKTHEAVLVLDARPLHLRSHGPRK